MFGRYQVDELIGRGGMGEVHRAHDTEQDRVVALKRLSVSLADDEARARFRRESRIAASLTSPHVVTIYDHGEIGGQLFLAMELVEGTDLRQLLAEGPLAPARAVEILAQVAAALDTAHAAGVVHRDVKPSNILLDSSGTAYLADFGIAKSLAPDATSVTRSGEIGTLDYMAPERLTHRGADHRADVYALACVLFECLTGKKPFPAEDSAGKLAAQLNDPPPAPSLFDWRIPPAVDLIIATGMDKDPARRYPTAGELMAAAATAFEELSVTSPLTTPDLAGDPGQGNIMHAIVAVATRQRQPAPADQCPYPGLRSFAESESDVFHGREHAITDVLVRLSRQSEHSGPLLVVGASGAGKSSLLRAGVLPVLAATEQPWPQVVTTPGPNPIASLAARLAPIAEADAGELSRWLHARPAELGKLCGQIARRRGGAHGRLVLVVDQFEELFTGGAAPGQREAFATMMANAWPALVVLTIRADFIDDSLRLRALEPALANPYLVGPLGAGELARVIVEPARTAGLRLEDGLVDRLITDIGAGDGAGYDPGALPRLAHVLRETWQNRSGTVLTLKGYQDTGGVDRAVALTADGVYNSLADADKYLLRTALLRMVTVLDTGGVARRKAARDEVPEHVVARLVDARLVTADAGGVQLSHDALLTAWPRLREWVEQDRQSLVLRQHLGQAASSWRASGRDDGELYRGARLAATLDWAQGRTDLTVAEREFLLVSERVRQRATRRLRGLTTGLAVFLVVALVAGVVAAVKWGDATREARNAEDAARLSESRRLAAESLADAATDPVGARRKALAAWHDSPTSQARGALLSNATRDYPVTFDSGFDTLRAVDVSPDGDLIAAAGPDGLVVIDTGTGEPIDVDLGDENESPVHDVEFSPDGTMLAASGDSDFGVRIWTMPDGERLRTLSAVGFVTWRADSGAVAAIGSPDLSGVAVGAWDPSSGKRIGWLTKTYPKGKPAPFDGAYSPDGKRFAVGRNDGAVELWEPAKAKLVHLDTAHIAAGGGDRSSGGSIPHPQVAFSGEMLVSASTLDARIRFADPVTGVPTGKSIGAGYLGGDLEFTPDSGHLLTVADTAVGVARWTVGPRQGVLGDGTFVQGPTHGGVGAFALNTLAVSARGDVVAGQIDGGIVAWPHNPGWNYAPLNWGERVAFAPGGDEVSALSTDDTVHTWDPTTGEPRSGDGPGVEAFGIAYLRDGTRIVAGRDGTVTLTDTGGSERSVRIDRAVTHGGVAVAPDGSMFAVETVGPVPGLAGLQTTVQVWDTQSLESRAVIDLGTGVASSPVFSPDGDTLLVAVTESGEAGSHELRRWRTSDFDQEDPIAVDAGGNVLYAPDGESLILADDNQVQIRDAETGEVRREFGEHPNDVRALALSPDGSTLATGTVSDPAVRLWNLATGAHVATLTGHTDGVNDLEFSPDGERLASASTDTDIGMWPVDPRDATDQLCDDLADAGEEDLTSLGCT